MKSTEMTDIERCELIDEAKTLSPEELAGRIAVLKHMLTDADEALENAIDDQLAVYEGEVYARDEAARARRDGVS